MPNLVDKLHCSGCSACASICPHEVISMQMDNEGFADPVIDENICINCALCEKVCPGLHQSILKSPLSVNAAKAKADNLRLESSSGGIFSILANNVLEHGGLVFGAAFDHSDWHVYHKYIDKKLDLHELRGSKYVQSDITNCFKEVKKALNDGREVLFTGTPCQIAGLRSYISLTNKSKSNLLLCVDVICHAVPSPLAWRKYLEQRVSEHNRHKNSELKDIKKIDFRNKDTGWKNFSIYIEFIDNMKYSAIFQEDNFMKGFLRELYNRPSCHDCKCKNFNSGSDITLGDYWGIDTLVQEMDDDKGVSLVIINTEKGKNAFDILSDKMEICVSDLKDAIIRNQAIVVSTSTHQNRTKFFRKIHKSKNFDKLVYKMLRLPMNQRIISFVRKYLRKIIFGKKK